MFRLLLKILVSINKDQKLIYIKKRVYELKMDGLDPIFDISKIRLVRYEHHPFLFIYLKPLSEIGSFVNKKVTIKSMHDSIILTHIL
jgi:hypothetical protein